MKFIKDFNSNGDVLLEKLRSLADGKTQVTLLRELNNATLDIIAHVCLKYLFYFWIYKIFSINFKKIAFGMNVNSINNAENSRLSICIKKTFEGLDRAFKDPLMRVNKTNNLY